jgi:hypothetical protein
MKTIIESALKFAQQKREFFGVVAALPADERWRIIAELSVVADEPLSSKASPPPIVPSTILPPPRIKRHYRKRRASKPGESYTSQLVSFLRDSPHTPLPVIAERIYGDHAKRSLGKTRSLLSALGSRHIVKRVGVGDWEVAQPSNGIH